MINRVALILKYKAPAIKWINDADPYQENPRITIENVNEERTVYLLREDVADTPEMLDEWLKLNCEILFEKELEGWYTALSSGHRIYHIHYLKNGLSLNVIRWWKIPSVIRSLMTISMQKMHNNHKQSEIFSVPFFAVQRYAIAKKSLQIIRCCECYK